MGFKQDQYQTHFTPESDKPGEQELGGGLETWPNFKREMGLYNFEIEGQRLDPRPCAANLVGPP